MVALTEKFRQSHLVKYAGACGRKAQTPCVLRDCWGGQGNHHRDHLDATRDDSRVASIVSTCYSLTFAQISNPDGSVEGNILDTGLS